MKRVALLFPGQGSQYVGMGKKLYENNQIVKKTFEEANDALNFNLMKLCFDGSVQELTQTENAQPAILTAGVAAFRVYIEEIGTPPSYLAGHSLGEITALTCSGAILFSDAVKLVKQRGKFMQEAVADGVGAMWAISGIDPNLVEKECRQYMDQGQTVVVSNYNTPEQIVISGQGEPVEQAARNMERLGATITKLKVSAPFHCPLMFPAVERLKAEIGKYEFQMLQYPVISNISATPYTDCNDIVQNLTLQLTQPVQWYQTMEYIKAQGIDFTIDMGPRTVLNNMQRESKMEFLSFSYEKDEDKNKLKQLLIPNQSEKANHRPTVLARCMAIAVCTRNTNWDNDEYQIGVIEPYNKIQQIQEELDQKNEMPSKEQMELALEMLKSVFVTKKTPVREQIDRFHQIFEETGTKELFSDFKIPVEELE